MRIGRGVSSECLFLFLSGFVDGGGVFLCLSFPCSLFLLLVSFLSLLLRLLDVDFSDPGSPPPRLSTVNRHHTISVILFTDG